MSSEHTINNKLLKNSNDISSKVNNDLNVELNKDQNKYTGRVNINNLMLRVREKEKKHKVENIVLGSLIGSIVVITGIIASL